MTRHVDRPASRVPIGAVVSIALLLGACDGRIGEPRALWALWLVPALAAFYVVSLRARATRLRRFASAAMIERLTGGASGRRGAFKAALVLVAVAALLGSLCGLQLGFTWEEVERRGVDIVVALDVSDSMRVEDAGRSLPRLERAKREIHDLLQLLSGDRIGIVAFAGTAFVQCPMTLDYGAAELFLAALDSDAVPVQGTDLAQALETSLGAFRGGVAGSRAILLITDGEDHSGRAVEVAQRLRAEGIRVFAIGIGSAGGAPIPAPGGGFRRDRAGAIILSRLDEPTLQQIALATDGRYVRSVTGDLDLEQIYTEGIKAALEDREIEAHRRQRWEDRFQWLVGLAIAALMIEALLSERSGGRHPQALLAARRAAEGERRSRDAAGSAVAAQAGDGRIGRPRPAAAVLTLLVLASSAPRAGGQPAGEAGAPRDSAETARAEDGAKGSEAAAADRFGTPEEAYEAGDFAQALDGFVDLQIERPEDTAVTMNVGSAHYRLDDLAAAARSFEAAGAAGEDQVRAQAWYDLGNVAYRQGRLEEAIESYHRSLDLDPRDQDAKFNLEVAQVALERQQQQQQQQQEQQQGQEGSGEQEKQDEGQGDDEPRPEEGEQGQGDDAGDRKESSGSGDEESEESEPGSPSPGAGEEERTGEEGAERAGQEGAAGGDSSDAAEGRLTAAEAQRLLDSIEEGRPRRRVPPGRQRDQEKDW